VEDRRLRLSSQGARGEEPARPGGEDLRRGAWRPAQGAVHPWADYFNDEEWNAFVEATPKKTNIIGVRIRSTGGETKLFRDGDYPVLRGTALLLDDQTAYLWTRGYVPQLDTTSGRKLPIRCTSL
jgi:hypothetical protein